MSVSSNLGKKDTKETVLGEGIKPTLRNEIKNKLKNSVSNKKYMFPRKRHNSNKRNHRLKRIVPTLPNLHKPKLDYIYGKSYRLSSSRTKNKEINRSLNSNQTNRTTENRNRTPDIRYQLPLKLSRFLKRFKLNQDLPIVLYPRNSPDINSKRSLFQVPNTHK